MKYEEIMLRAISEAEKYKYTAKPNPVVGAILMKDKEIISEGYHVKYGKNHAEINALINACLLYTSPSPRDGLLSRMPSSA